jgi:hypothetical protein
VLESAELFEVPDDEADGEGVAGGEAGLAAVGELIEVAIDED